jgi:tetratricopeptide (TPR) repeat protein
MDEQKIVVELCVAGTQAEFNGQLDLARRLYWRAWEAAEDDADACIAAHYVARFQEKPEDRLLWNKTALERAQAASNERVQSFYPSLYLNMGRSFELLGQFEEAQYYYNLAAELGAYHQPDL